MGAYDLYTKGQANDPSISSTIMGGGYTGIPLSMVNKGPFGANNIGKNAEYIQKAAMKRQLNPVDPLTNGYNYLSQR